MDWTLLFPKTSSGPASAYIASRLAPLLICGLPNSSPDSCEKQVRGIFWTYHADAKKTWDSKWCIQQSAPVQPRSIMWAWEKSLIFCKTWDLPFLERVDDSRRDWVVSNIFLLASPQDTVSQQLGLSGKRWINNRAKCWLQLLLCNATQTMQHWVGQSF